MKRLSIFLYILVISVASRGQTLVENDMVDQINKLRSDPKSFIPYVEDYIRKQEQLLNLSANVKRTIVSDGETKIVSGQDILHNNIQEAKNLIKVLYNTKPMSKVVFRKDMYFVSIKHGAYLDSLGHLEHNNPNVRFKTINVIVFENLAICNNCSVIDCLIELLLDTGYNTSGYGHRANLLDPKHKYVTVYKSKIAWIQDFSH